MQKHSRIKSWAMMSLGAVLSSAGIYFFKFPNHFSTGGVSGMAVILGHWLPSLTPGAYVYVINLALLAVGYLFLGHSFGYRTAYVTILMSTLIWLAERLIPLSEPLTSQPLLELIFAVLLPAVGSALLFNHDASTGGTDIIAMIVQQHTSMDIGKALLCTDVIITVAACFAFGIETGLFSILGLLIKSVIVDMVIENLNTRKCLQVITSKPEIIEDYIIHRLNRGATRISAQGIYTHEDRTVLLTVMNRRQASMLRRYVRQVDPHSFIMITNSSEIIGKGFGAEA